MSLFIVKADKKAPNAQEITITGKDSVFFIAECSKCLRTLRSRLVWSQNVKKFAKSWNDITYNMLILLHKKDIYV
jgi:hypothetical protein